MSLFDRLRRIAGGRIPATPGAAAESLIAAQRRLVGDAPGRVIFDVGAHHGHSTAEYLNRFPSAQVHGFEPDPANHATAQAMLGTALAGRGGLHRLALAEAEGTATLHVNSHDGTHSLLEIGEQRYWGAYAAKVEEVAVETTTLDRFCSAHAIGRIDILKMDIQGGELAALRGAAGLLSRGAVGLVTLEVEFQPLYRNQPLMWEVGAFLQGYGYGFYGLYDCVYHARNPNVLSWADAIFLGPGYLDVPQWESPE